MFKNMSQIDRILRLVIAVAIAWAYFTDRIAGTLGIVLLVVAVLFLVTSLRGFCPAYLLFRKRV
jgi:hypothetical protein